MYTSYLACSFGTGSGKISLGTLDKGRFNVSTLRRFDHARKQSEDGVQWDIAGLFQHLTDSLGQLARAQETVNGVSCTSWGEDYLMFDAGGALITPVGAPPARAMARSLETLRDQVSRESLFEETGTQPTPGSTLVQLGAEKPRRLSQVEKLLPVADGFNFLLSGQARVELSSASTTQLFNPVLAGWSTRMLDVVRLPAGVLPPLVDAGTLLGPLRQEIAGQTGIEDVEVVASCSHEMAATLAGLPVDPGMHWAFLQMDTHSVIGTELPQPLLSPAALERGYTNQLDYDRRVRFSKPTAGLWILEECQRYWAERGEDLDLDMMMHLAGVSDPFESLINPMAPVFLTPGDMPQKIKGFCRETGQPIPRKPGAIIRCVLESIALHYRRVVREMEQLTGERIECVHLLPGGTNIRHPLFYNFIANALQVPLVICPEETTATGNILVQAVALKHLSSLDEGRGLARQTLRPQTVQPYSGLWETAYQRLEQLG